MTRKLIALVKFVFKLIMKNLLKLQASLTLIVLTFCCQAQVAFPDSATYYTYRNGPSTNMVGDPSFPTYFKEVLWLDSVTTSGRYYSVQRHAEKPDDYDYGGQDSFAYNLRVSNGQVFYSGPVDELGKTAHDLLMYDFNLEAGDTLSVSSAAFNYKLRIERVNTIKPEDGIERRSQFVSVIESNTDFSYGSQGAVKEFRIYEGLGSVFGLVCFQIVRGGSFYGLDLISVCDHENMIYKSPVQHNLLPGDFCTEDHLNSLMNKYRKVSVSDLDMYQLEIFPNPVGDVLTIVNERDHETYEIVDAQGRKVLNGSIEEEIDVAQLNKGVYYFLVKGEGQVRYGRFLKR
ncbi:MAG: T9SS type A sorting domain-containing protein [Bacteroidia bacterium]|nr:T9SS type A sorting domain-containing protein [Bacteroidia bacterium]